MFMQVSEYFREFAEQQHIELNFDEEFWIELRKTVMVWIILWPTNCVSSIKVICAGGS